MSGIWTGWRVHRHAAQDALPLADRRAPGEGHHLLGQVVGGAEVEGFGRLVVLEDGAGVGPGQLAGAGHDGLEHRVQIERRAERPADLAERPKLAHRARQVLGPGFEFLEQPHVLDRDHRLVGEGGYEVDLLCR